MGSFKSLCRSSSCLPEQRPEEEVVEAEDDEDDEDEEEEERVLKFGPESARM